MLMLVPHEPTLDPRVHYTATSLARRYDLTVVSIARPFERRPADNYPEPPTYRTLRLPLQRRGALGAGMAFCDLFLQQRLGGNRVVRALPAAAMNAALLVLIGMAAALLVPVELLRARGESDRSGARAALRGVLDSLSIFRFNFRVTATFLRHLRHSGLAADAVYCHDLYSLQTGVGLKQRSACRVIYDSHEYYPYLHRYWVFRRLTQFYEGVLVSFADTYITVSPPLARELETLYGRDGIVAIPNVEPRPAAGQAALRSELSALAGERLKLLYQGHFAEGRGLEEVLREWRAVDGGRVALFLRGPPSRWRDRLEAMAKEAGFLGNSVYLLPPVLERDLIAAAREADLGLIPYKGASPAYRFACPNKLSQYLHAGLGIVANAIPFVRDLVDERGIGVCYAVDEPGSFARAVNRLAGDPAAVANLKHAAETTARDSYRWESYESRFLESIAAP